MDSFYPYQINMPAKMETGREYPAVFALHGRGSNEQDMLGLAEPLFEDFIVLAIRGDLPLGPGYQFYELKSIGNPDMESFEDAVRKLEAFIEYATAKYPVDAGRRYMLGFSQGAIMSMTLALKMGSRLKGIVALNGYIPEFVKNDAAPGVKDLSVFISHGERDHIFPIVVGEENAAYFRTHTSNCTFKKYLTGHGVGAENQRDLVQWLYKDAGVRR